MLTGTNNIYTGSIRLPEKLSSASRLILWVSLAVVFLISSLDIISYISGIIIFKRIESHWIPMNLITAVFFILSGIALYISRNASLRNVIIVRIIAITITLVSLLTIIDYIYILVSGKETLLTKIPFLKIFILSVYRMAFMSAFIFMFTGCILYLFSLNHGTADNIAHVLIFPAALASYFIPVSYILNIYTLDELLNTQVALNAGIAFCALCTAVFVIRQDTWFMRVFTSKSTGGILARRLLPGFIALPLIIGWLRIYGEHSNLFESEFGVAVVALTYTVFFILLLWLATRSVNLIDEKRNLFEEALIKTYNELEAVNLQLGRELKERNLAEEALRKSEAQLLDLNATKDKFFNIVAHDLKNPFTSMLGSTELLYENINRLEAEEIRKLAKILNDSAKNGYAILLNLLDWSRSQTGLIKYNPEEIHLGKLIDENISSLELYAANKEIRLTSEVGKGIIIITDKNMLNTVLRNLLSNAIKFTHRSGNVIVSSDIMDNEVIVSVKDTGTGISEGNIQKLFRLDSRFQLPGTDMEQGTGLGLKLSREFVEKLGGRIWVESVENTGSVFSFTIPVQSRDM